MDYASLLLRIAEIPSGEIKNARKNLFHELIHHLGINKLYSLKDGDGAIAKGGQGVIIKATAISDEKVVIKVALPDLLKRGDWWQRRDEKKRLGKIPWVEKKFDTEDSARFFRGVGIQKQLYEYMRNHGLNQYGYIPKIVQVGKAPKPFVVMEYLDYEQLLDYTRDKTDEQKLDLFLKMVSLLEFVVHKQSIVHSDLKPNNWLVSNGYPCLLDFILAVNVDDELNKVTGEKTLGHGSELYSSTKQLIAFKHRDYLDDIWTMCLTFWVIMAGYEPALVGNTRNPGEANEVSINQVFIPEAIEEKYRTIFKRGTGGLAEADCYLNITELRQDLELCLDNIKKTTIRKTEIHVHKNKLNVDWAELRKLCAEDEKNGTVIYQIFKFMEKIL